MRNLLSRGKYSIRNKCDDFSNAKCFLGFTLQVCIMITSSNGNIFRVTGPLCGEFTGHRGIPFRMASFDVFFDLRLNKRLSTQSRRRCFETQSRSLWRLCNVWSCHAMYGTCGNKVCTIADLIIISSFPNDVATLFRCDNGAIITPWASYQIPQIAGCACARNAGNVFPATASKRSRHASRHVRDARDVMHVESLTSGSLWSRWRGKRSRHSRRMYNPQYYVIGKRPCVHWTRYFLVCISCQLF